MGGESKAEINRLRLRAARIGITIRTQRANGTDRRAYSLIERTTGRVLHHDVDGLLDVEAVLSRITWDRQVARADGPPLSHAPNSCPSCSTPRIGQFRFCRTCGRDFESTSHVIARWPPFQLQEPASSGGPLPPIEQPIPTRRVPIVERGPEVYPDPQRRGWPRLHIPFTDRDTSFSMREVMIGAMLGLFIGAVTALVSIMRS